MTTNDVGRSAVRRSPSMGEVASHAGVSAQTVSRVANGLANVQDDTRERVLSAMRELGYRPNRAARALRSGAFGTIGVIAFTLSSFGNIRTLDALSVAAAAEGYSITVIRILDPTIGRIEGAYDRLRENAVDGVVLIFEAHLIDDSEVDLPAGLPVVVVDSNASSHYSVVDTDQALGACQATQHLLDLGHRTVRHVAGPAHSFSAGRRADAWARTLTTAGAPLQPVLHGDWSAESGYRAGREFVEDPSVTAVFAANDQMALGVMRVLHEEGRRIPQDVSVVGFDDTEESAMFWPPLTSVHQDFGEVGRRCIRMLLAAIAEPGREAERVLVPTRLVPRASSGPVGAGA